MMKIMALRHAMPKGVGQVEFDTYREWLISNKLYTESHIKFVGEFVKEHGVVPFQYNFFFSSQL